MNVRTKEKNNLKLNLKFIFFINIDNTKILNKINR